MTKKFTLLVCASLFFTIQLLAQIDVKTIDMGKLNQAKLDGKLNGHEKYVNYDVQGKNPSRVSAGSTGNNTVTAANGCNCWVPRDATWQVAQFDGSGGSGGPGVAPDYRNDDWTTVELPLPFNFCFYGRQVDSVYINNNGNVSIDNPYSTFTANSFPDPSYVMIAPFWGDVDTRGALSGIVYYQMTSTHLIIQWENVGYFGTHDDKLNTFQLIMTNGTDLLLPPGSNVSFCYKDMQWTTGDASSGVGGFGGTPATVGVNQGNGIDYIQIGLFDTAGPAYDGPYGANDGIDALDNQSFLLNVCQSGSNVPPILNSVQTCDTLDVCEGDTLFIQGTFLSPEQGQITTVTTASLMTGLSLINTTPANTTDFTVQVIGLPSNLGMNQFDLIGTDNGTPARSTRVPIVIHVWPAPTATYTISPATTVNVGDVVTFTNTSTIGLTYNWDFGDGTNSAVYSPTHSYAVGGTYNVTLTVTSPAGCIQTITQQVNVFQCASAAFTATSVCQNTTSTVTFTGVYLASTVFTWNFGSGTVVSGSGSGPYTISWATPGTYQIDVSVDGGGCATASASQQVTIYQVPVATVSNDAQVCNGAPANVTFTGTAPAGAAYTWNFSGGNAVGSAAGPYDVTWNTPGTYPVDLIVSANGCADTISTSVIVNAIPTSNFNATPTVCLGSPVTVNFTGTAGGTATYNWNFGGGTVVSGSGAGPYTLIYNTAGSTNVSLTVDENGCTSMPSSQSVVNNPIPNASINATPALCTGAANSVTFNGTATGTATYNWTFGSGTVASGSGAGPYSVSWNAAGPQVLSVIVLDAGCTDTATFNVNVNAIPTAVFTATPSACAGDPITVNYTGTATASASYTWNFNGANVASGSGQGPYTLNWPTSGNYTLSLDVTENGCAAPPQSVPVVINAIPVASVAPASAVCVGQPGSIAFNGTALPGASYTWSFGSGTVMSGSGAGPYSVQWAAAGSQSISLTVTQNGCTNSTTSNITVNPIPTAQFTIPPSICVNNPFPVAYTGDGNASATYDWNFNGATIVSGVGSGPYSLSSSNSASLNVSLVVTQLGCVSPANTQTIFIAPLPVVNAGADASVCSGTNVTLGVSPSANTTYVWTPASGLDDPTVGQTLMHAINNDQGTTTDTYILTATTNYGCVNKDTVSVQTKAIPAAIFAHHDPACLDDNAFMFVPNGHVFPGVTYSWNFQGGTPSSSQSAVPGIVQYSAIGKYVVTLNSSYEGCPGPAYTDTIQINPMPRANFLPAVFEGCEPLTVPLANLSTLNSATFHWEFSDGTLDTAAVPTHVFAHAGEYSIKLTSITADGCSHDTTMLKIIKVYPMPIADFIADPAVTSIYEPVIQFQNHTVNGDTYQWTFGDSATSTLVSPNHTYAEVGAYEVVLMTSTNHNCRDTTRGIVRVEYGYSFYVPSAFTPNGDGVNDFFQGYGSFIKDYEMSIYDRWGILVYKTSEYDKPWDGKIKNREVENDVFVYRIQVTDQKDSPHTYLGKITLIR